MQGFIRNLRFGARMLGRSPGFTLATGLTLALGIGVNTAIFTIVNSLLLRPFPFHDPEQLVGIVSAEREGHDHGGTLLRYELVRDQSRSFQSVAVWAYDTLNLSGRGEPVQAAIARVSPSFFAVFGVRPELGRVFAEAEGRPEGDRVVMLSDALWRSRYGADPSIVGRTVTLDSTAYTVVGVLPASAKFAFMGPANVWTPRYFEYSLMPTPRLRLGVGYLNLVARLKADVSLKSANDEMALLNRRYVDQNPSMPDAGADVSMAAQDLRSQVAGDVRGKLWMLTAAVGVVLLIACANVASLLLSRALARRKEIAVRTALGASRGAIFRQLLVESLMLAMGAGVAGAAMGWAAVPALVKWGATELPGQAAIGIDWRVLLFTLGVSLLAGVAFGVAPAIELARVEPNITLRDEGRGASAGRTRAHAQSALVVAQVALSLVLLIGAGLLLRSFVRLMAVDPGFDASNLMTMNLSLSTVKYAKPDQQMGFFNDVLERVSALPGVRSAAISAATPLSIKRITPMLPEGQPEVPLGERQFLAIEAVSPRWFDAMRVPVQAGRVFSQGDDAHGPRVAIVNASFAREFWPRQNAIGKHIVIGRGPATTEVVGVSADVKNSGLEKGAEVQVYVPFAQLPWSEMNLLVRTSQDPKTAVAAISAAIHAMDSDQPITDIRTAGELLDTSRAQPRFFMVLVVVFAGAALALAVIGIYGVLAFAVAQRRQEFGIRMALGAVRGDILRLVMGRGLALTLAGIAAGLVVALAVTRLAAGMLYGVNARDAVSFVAAPMVLLAVALVASAVAAQKATKVDPIEAMR